MPLINATPAFEQRYASHLKHLKLKGERVRSCFHTLVCLIARPDSDLRLNLNPFRFKTSYLSHTNPLSVDGKMEVAARGDADETLGQDFLEPGTRGSDGQL